MLLEKTSGKFDNMERQAHYLDEDAYSNGCSQPAIQAVTLTLNTLEDSTLVNA